MALTKKSELWLPNGLFIKKPSATKGLTNLRDTMVALLIETGLINADPCCDDFVEGSSPAFSRTASTGLTADTGSAQTDATELTAHFNEVTTSGTAGDSVLLPPAEAGLEVVVFNDAAANAIDVFPNTSDTINDGSANAAFSVGAGATVVFRAVDATNWETDRQKVQTDTLIEQTAAAGVTIDGLVIKDSRLEYNATGFFGVTKTADTTLTIDETGFIFGNKSTALTLTLPATVVGFSYFVVNINGGGVINLSPNASDYIGGAGLSKNDNKDLIIPAVKGAYAQIIADGVNGWYIAQGSGTLTKEA